MTGREIVKSIMEKQGISNADMAKRLNITNAAMWDRVNSPKVKDIPLSILSDMLRVMDYKIQIVPVKKNKANDPNPTDVGTFDVK